MPEPTTTHTGFFSYDDAQRIKEVLSYHIGQPFRFNPMSDDRQVLVLIQVIPSSHADSFRMNLVAQGAFLPVLEFCELNNIVFPA